MQQLRVMAKLVNNGSSTRPVGVENTGETLQFEQQKTKSVRPKQIAKKNATTASAANSGGGGGGRQRSGKSITTILGRGETEFEANTKGMGGGQNQKRVKYAQIF